MIDTTSDKTTRTDGAPVKWAFRRVRLCPAFIRPGDYVSVTVRA